MSKIYNLIENQVNILLRFVMEDDMTGQVNYGAWIKGPKEIQLAVQVITTLVFIFIALFFGLYLWNYGLQPAFPGLVARIDGSNPAQATNPYSQLILTLLAIMMFM